MLYYVHRRPTGISARLKAVVGVDNSPAASGPAIQPHHRGNWNFSLVTYPGGTGNQSRQQYPRVVSFFNPERSPYPSVPCAVQLFSSLSRCRLSEMQEPVVGKLDNHVLPKDVIPFPSDNVHLGQLSRMLHSKIMAFLECDPPTELMQNVQRKTRISLDVLKEALDRYGLEKLALSYNGGKDCLVLLVLWLVVLHKYYGQSQNASAVSTSANSGRASERFPDAIDTVYIQSPHSFVEVDDFVRDSSRQYHLDLCTLNKPMRAAFEDYLQMKPKIEAIFVGTRRNDPHGAALSHFNPTDGNWPKFMRCHPVIDWHYREIWGFIRHFGIPYCPLYDLGFTSLGGTKDTFPNPRLKIEGSAAEGKGGAGYRPAYELLEDDDERLGRNVGKP